MIPYDSEPQSLISSLRGRFPSDSRVLTLDEWTKERSSEKPLAVDEMQEIVDIARRAIQGLYVHLDLKLARRGVDPVRQLSVFRERLKRDMPPRAFHEGMLRIFKSLGDAHTAYRLPEPYKSAIGFLPFLINTYERPDRTRGYVVSHVLPDCDKELGNLYFSRGVEILSWNGIPIEDAVRAATEFEEGSNLSNDVLLTLQFMTVRWLGASFGPESPWVVVGYQDDHGEYHEAKFYWLILQLGPTHRIIVSPQAVDTIFQFRSVQSRERALHIASAKVHLGRKALFFRDVPTSEPDPQTLERLGQELMAMFFGYVGRAEMKAFTDAHPELRRDGESDEYRTLLPMFLVAREHRLTDVIAKAGGDLPPALKAEPGLSFGYIGIRAFPPSGFARELFTYELRRLLNLMPGGGLVIDIRDNPGGSANLAEESLQLLTPRPITPLPFRFLATPSTQEIVEEGMFSEYKASIDTAMQTGGRFSAGRPITPTVHANEVGQHYFGPVVLLTNAATYSAADIFAAGFTDHEIGAVIGVDESTGGGGANCWFYEEDVTIALKSAKPLPQGVNMQIAVRQCSRVGLDNDGVLIEEVGVRPKTRQPLTRADILDARPWRLLLQAVSHFSDRRFDLVTSLVGRNGQRRVSVQTQNIDRLDFVVNGRPFSQNAPAKGSIESPPLPADDRVELEIRGYVSPNELVARYVQVFPFVG